MRLSVVLATYNEENNISACLESVVSWCDEIIVVDGSSQDKTVYIAKHFGARILVTQNHPLFHINKQLAIDKARGDWILQLDADEIVTPELRKEIDQAIKKKDINGYWLPRKNYFLGRFLMKGGIYPDYTLRLYRRNKGKLPLKDVHEQAVVEGQTDYLKTPLIHMADTSLARYTLRFKRYTDFIAKQLKTKNEVNGVTGFIEYVLYKPTYWFLFTYFRHKGFLDSWQGLLFSFLSALRYPLAYFKYKLHKV